MKLDVIEMVEACRLGVEGAAANLREKRKECTEYVEKLVENCDHDNPNGTSALVDGYFFSVCMICGRKSAK